MQVCAGGMSPDPVPRRLNELTESTREALGALEAADPDDQRRCLETLHRRFYALRQLESHHVEPLLLTQAHTQNLARACQKARSRVTPLLEELDRTPVSDPDFGRILARFAEAMRRLLDRTTELLANLDHVLSPEHRALLSEALDQSEPIAV